MKLSITKLFILAPAALLALTACNKSDDEDTTDYALDYDSSTLVSSFNIRPNTKVLANLDSVFFSIDQVKAEIFNADSLPWGTDVRKLVVNVTTQRSATIEIMMPSLEDGKNVTVSTSDSINFTSESGVWMRVTSNNGERERVYTVKVNVHQCNPDSLQWEADASPLPCAALAGLKEVQAVDFNDKVCLLAATGSQTTLYTTDNAASAEWAEATTNLPANADINSLCATPDALYVLTASGSLQTSTDGLQWTEATSGWSHLYGAYADQAVGVKGNEWVCYPGSAHGTIPAGMPVSGTSRLWTFTNDWAITPTALFVGGRDSQGNLSTNAWGFDGTTWAQLSGLMDVRQLPAAEGYTLFPYFTFKVNTTTYMVNKQSAWFAFGGKKADGTLVDKVYLSLDNGVNWNEADESLQLPKAIAPRSQASALLSYKTFYASRAIRPITQWDAPYLCLFGGYDASGALLPQTWVGVVNRLTFKPLQ
ncbi:MAG: DUF6242 domain-containing protein [Bacteroides sp.]|nr:DUF6242 domain-containing protein [Bacteroides sp.]MCM1379597.1 DUF6242 domain-containing protein [Bacteroides sp.]MCM1446021.1 DUF6242 domain-containing protein [Prevotella sp.]